MAKQALTLLALVSLSACAQSEIADAAPSFATTESASVVETPALTVFAATPYIAHLAQTAADRLRAATGIDVLVTDEPFAPGAVPMFWTTQGEGEWFGVTHADGANKWLSIDEHTPEALLDTVVLHEVLHALGAEHVGTGEGVLSPEIFAAFTLTTADLESVCAVAACTSFVAE
jgi:hypothetical protein